MVQKVDLVSNLLIIDHMQNLQVSNHISSLDLGKLISKWFIYFKWFFINFIPYISNYRRLN